jgi:hypothetical protein
MKHSFLSSSNYLIQSGVKPITHILFSLLLFTHINCYSQNRPLKGSGKIVNKSFEQNNFDKIDLLDLDGKIEVEVGKPFAISVAIDDNLEPLLEAAVFNTTLTIKLRGNLSNRLYIEETNINIKISLPEVSFIKHRSNGTLTVNRITGQYFGIKNTGNGSAYLNGSIDELEIVCRDNGSVNAKNLKIKKLDVKRSGNGNVYANAEEITHKQSSGNGSVITDKKDEDKDDKIAAEKTDRPVTSIKNSTAVTVKLSVIYPVKGAYGIAIKPDETKQEYFPMGTKIYKGNQFTLFKKALFEVTAQNQRDTFAIN